MTAEKYLEEIPMWAAKKNSLADIRAYLEELGSPDDAMKIIHVAGTNGKGSVCAFCTSMLRRAGYRVLTFVSPHLVTVRERFLLDGAVADEETFERVFEKVRTLSEAMTARGYQPPTYFEFLFYMAMVLGEQYRPDFVILETGLGGRLDVTNVIRRPLVCVITSISRDHMQYLGETIPQIAAEKAGILKPGVSVVLDAWNGPGESRSVIEERAQVLSCPCHPVEAQDMRKGLEAVLTTRADYQKANASVALRVMEVLRDLDVLSMTEEQMLAGIRESYWPGRMEEVLPGVYLDGAHNEGGMEALGQVIRRLQKETEKPVSLMFGVVSDKDHPRMIKKLCQGLFIRQVTIARMDTERCAPIEQLVCEFQEAIDCPVTAFGSVREAWEYFLGQREGAVSFCAGSLYLVGEVKELLRDSEGRQDTGGNYDRL